MKTLEADKHFPGFKNAFDIDAVKNVIGESFRKTRKDIAIEECVISDVKYEPGKQCIILYRTKLTDNYFKKSWEQLFLGKVLKRNEEDNVLPKEAIYAKGLGIIFAPFPHDPSMPWLPEAYSSAAMKENMALILQKDKWKIKEITIELLAYTPLMRATFLYKIHATDKKTGENLVFEWIAKTNVFKTSHRVFANYWALWKEANDKIPMPKPTGFLISPQMTFQEKINGIRLGAIVDAPNIDQIMEDLAHHIACFHNLKIPVRNTRKLEQEVRTLNRWSEVLMDLRPDLKMRMECLRKNIVAEMEKRIIVEAPIHADFHHTNILVDGSRVQLIDMDEMAYGDPCVDIGRFLSSLRIPSLRTYGSFDGLKQQRELFIETYLKNSKRDERDIHLFESAALFTSAASAFRLQRQNWEEEVPMLLEESEKTFKASKIGKSLLKRPAKNTRQKLSKENYIHWAKDEIFIKTLLAPHFYRKNKQVILSCELMNEDMRKGYHRFYYQITSTDKKKRFKDKIELFVHNDKERRFIYDFVDFLNKEMKDTQTPDLFPRPIAHLPEIGGLVFFRNYGSSIATLLGSEKSREAAEQLAAGLASLHRVGVELVDCNSETMQDLHHHECDIDWGISEDGEQEGHKSLRQKIQIKKKEIRPKTAYLLKEASPYNVKMFNDTLQIAFPIRKHIGHPYSDIGNFTVKMIHYGLENHMERECEKFIDDFNTAYSTAAKASLEELAVFQAEMLLNEACKILKKKEFEIISAMLLKKAEMTLARISHPLRSEEGQGSES